MVLGRIPEGPPCYQAGHPIDRVWVDEGSLRNCMVPGLVADGSVFHLMVL
jgi:hypothetical protein